MGFIGSRNKNRVVGYFELDLVPSFLRQPETANVIVPFGWRRWDSRRSLASRSGGRTA